MNELVSVGIAVYNGEKTVERAIVSILNQSHKNLEIIIIDDNSTDNSFNICSKFSKKDQRIKLFKNELNMGLIKNFNDLFIKSSGEFFLWSDQDDIRDKTFVEKTLNILRINKSSVLCHCVTKVFFENPKNIFHINYMKKIANTNNVVSRYKNLLWFYNDTNIYALIRSSSLKKTNLWKKMNGSSNNLLFELCLLGKFEYINESLFLYSGKEITKRPSIREEYKIISKESSPILYSAGLILFFNQFFGIIYSNISFYKKFIISLLLIHHFFLINISKIIFRIFFNKKSQKIPKYINIICKYLYPDNTEVKNIVDVKKYPDYFPKYEKFIKLK